MDGPRKRLVPFMKRMIGRCPGVMWENPDECTFRIPWRHYNNREWTETDSKIFFEWAKLTGKYKQGDDYDWPAWKTQLRCALNKIPDIEHVPELNQLDGPNPYRVYKFVTAKREDGSPSMSESSPGKSPQSDADDRRTNSPRMEQLDRILEFQMNTCGPIHTDASNLLPTVVKDEEEKHSQLENPVYFDMENDRSSPQTYGGMKQHDYLTGETFTVPFDQLGQINVPGVTIIQIARGENPLGDCIVPTERVQSQSTISEEMMEATNLPSDLKSVESENLCPYNVSLPSEINSIPSSFGSNTTNSLSNDESGRRQAVESSEVEESPVVRQEIRTMPSDVQEQISGKLQQMQINFRMFYGFHQQIQVNNGRLDQNGCRFFFSRMDPGFWDNTILQTPETFGPPGADQIRLPSPLSHSDIEEVQQNKLMQLLDNMERGLVVTVHPNGDIYANRLCKTRVFVTDGCSFSNSLDRQDGEIKIFDFLKQYEKKVSTLTLTFGQEIKKGHKEPMKRILMSLEIEHESLRNLLDEQPRSFNSSIGPLISNDDKNDKLIEGFKTMLISAKQL